MGNIKWDVFTCVNTKSDEKPNEDLAVFNQELCVGMLLDGVSRDKEGGIYPVPSPSAIATEIFAEEFQKQCSCLNTIGLGELEKAIRIANKKVNEYNSQLRHRFPAGTVGIVFAINNGFFHYAYIGDCYATIIRGNNRRTFSECQTTNVIKHKREYTSDVIRFDICNHVSHPCGYGVWDGNPNAMDFVKYGSIKLRKDDVIFLYSDGLEKEVAGLNNFDLEQKALSTLFTECPEPGNDDRTCLRLTMLEEEYHVSDCEI